MMKYNDFLTKLLADGLNERLRGTGLATVERERDDSLYILLEVDHYGDREVVEILKDLHSKADSTECYHDAGVVVYHFEEGVNVYALFDWEKFKRA